MLDEAEEWNHGPSNNVVNLFNHNVINFKRDEGKTKGRIITKGGHKKKTRAE